MLKKPLPCINIDTLPKLTESSAANQLNAANTVVPSKVSSLLSAENLKKLENGAEARANKAQTELQLLIAQLERDQVEKEIGNTLKTVFLACNVTEEGFVEREEFETKLKSFNLLISSKTMDRLFGVITSKKDKGMVSFTKVKQLCDELKKVATKIKDKYHAKDLMYGKITSKENFLDHPLINLLEIKMEEKYKTIHDAFRTFDTNGDSKLKYDEFVRGVLNLGTDLSEEDIKKAFDMLDENANGEIEYHEFCASFDGYKRRGNPLVTSQQTKDICAGVMKLNEINQKFRRDPAIKYSPPALYGFSNSGVANPLTNRLHKFRNSDGVSGFGSKTSRKLDFGNEEETQSKLDDILSQASIMRSKMNIPDPK